MDPSRDTADRIARTLMRAGHEAFLVGGCVRDLVMGSPPEDYDIATDARPDEVRRLFEHTIPVGEAFGVMMVVEDGAHYEVATFRAESGYADGRRPSEVRFATAEEDVRRRDFTVNGLLMDPETGEVADLVGGRADVERRVIRTIGPPAERFAEDHLRMLRAVRFAAKLDFSIDPETARAVAEGAGLIRRVSAERVREELTRTLTGPSPRRGIELASGLGLLKEVLPEVERMHGVEQRAAFHPEGDVWEHTMKMLELMRPGPDPRLAWGVLLHDVGKPLTMTEDETGTRFYGHSDAGVRVADEMMTRLRFSRAQTDTVKQLIGQHMRFMHVAEMRPGKLKRLLRMPDFDLHLELHRLDCEGSHGKLENHRFCLRKLEELGAEELRPEPLLTGRDLIEMGFVPGPLFGEILGEIEDEQLEGRLGTSEEARALVIERWGDRRGTDAPSA